MKDIVELAKLVQKVNTIEDNTDKNSYLKEISQKFLVKTQNQMIPDVTQLAESYGFKVGIQILNENQKGYVTMNSKCKSNFGSDKIIVVNKMDNYEEKRYTIAILMSYFLLNYSEDMQEFYDVYCDDLKSVKKYVKAKKIANNILMPEERFKKECNKKYKTGKNPWEELVKIFKVPRSAIEYRLAELNMLN